MVPAGKALGTQFGVAAENEKASLGFGLVAVPSEADASGALAEMRKILSSYAQKGVPADLVEASKRSEVTEAQFRRNSIPGLASVWSDALAAKGRNSPEEDVDAISQGDRRRREPRGKTVPAERQHDHRDTEARAERRSRRRAGLWRAAES